MNYKLVVADVDGTLLVPNAHGKTAASEKVIAVVDKVQKLGVKISFATARSLDWVEGLIDSLHPQAPIILDNGARIYDPLNNKYMFEALIQPGKIKEIVTLLKTLNKEIIIVDKTGRFNFDERKTDFPAIKIMVLHQPPQTAHDIYKELEKISDITVTKSISGENPTVESIHITSPVATKENGMIHVLQYLKIKPDEVIGIGDSYNDAGFLKLCGLKAAMDNAVPEIKAIADYVAPSHADDGVADVLKKFVLIK